MTIPVTITTTTRSAGWTGNDTDDDTGNDKKNGVVGEVVAANGGYIGYGDGVVACG